MKTTTCQIFIPIVIIMMVIIIFPFLPGKYDPLAMVLSIFLQIYSSLALLTIIPASLWLLRNIRYPTNVLPGSLSLLKHRIFFKIYYWLSALILLASLILTGFGMSLTFGIVAAIALVYLSIRIWKKFNDPQSHHLLFSKCLPASLALLPVILVSFQMVLEKPLSDWSRSRAISKSRELIVEIERYRDRTGSYPLTLNAVHKDYLPGVAGIEQYHYAYDSSTFNLYFEQPRFLFNRPGTREFVVYNPDDRHTMMSHALWHIILEPGTTGNIQGWYESAETGHPKWKSFLFD